MTSIRHDRMPWIVTGVVALVLVVGLGYLLAARAGQADTVQQVADQAVRAVQRYDVRAGGTLLCDPLTDEQRARLEALVQAGKERADDPDPELDIAVSNVRGDRSGSFQVRVTSPEPGLIGVAGAATVIVVVKDGRSCIAGLEGEDYQGGLDPR